VYAVPVGYFAMKLAVWLGLILALSVSAAAAQTADRPAPPANPPVPVEVFQVLELPVAINGPVLVKTKGGYFLKCSLANSSEFQQLGLRYSLVVLDSADGTTRKILTVSEAFALPAYQTKTLTFKTPLKVNLNGRGRVVLMLQQFISADYVWEVINPREALRAYIAGDYSITPRVLRVSNQVDARPVLSVP
jgi:hypothetical protein